MAYLADSCTGPYPIVLNGPTGIPSLLYRMFPLGCWVYAYLTAMGCPTSFDETNNSEPSILPSAQCQVPSFA